VFYPVNRLGKVIDYCGKINRTDQLANRDSLHADVIYTFIYPSMNTTTHLHPTFNLVHKEIYLAQYTQSAGTITKTFLL
jgi:hypothetical protein